MSQLSKQSLQDELRQRRILDEPALQRLQQQAGAPWFMTLLSGLAAWLAAALLIGSTLFTIIDDSALAGVLTGVILLGLAVWLVRQPGVFVSQLGLALSLVGQGLLVLAVDQLNLWSAHSQQPPAVMATLVAGAMLLVPAPAVHRLACALIAMAAGAVCIGFSVLLAPYGLLLAGLAMWLWLRRSRWADSQRAGLWRALAGGATLAGLVLPMLAQQRWVDSLLPLLGAFAASLLGWLYPLGAGILLLGVTLYLMRGQSAGMRVGAIVAVLMLAAPGIQAPGLLVAAALWLAVFHACERFWCVLVGVGTALYLGDFYYSLHISLLHKSLLLLVSGALLLVLRWILLRLTGEDHEI